MFRNCVYFFFVDGALDSVALLRGSWSPLPFNLLLPGALAKVPTSDKMELNVHHMAYAGVQVFAANQYISVTY
jgi:hypothetical protein